MRVITSCKYTRGRREDLEYLCMRWAQQLLAGPRHARPSAGRPWPPRILPRLDTLRSPPLRWVTMMTMGVAANVGLAVPSRVIATERLASVCQHCCVLADDRPALLKKPVATFEATGATVKTSDITPLLNRMGTFFLPWNQVDLIFGKSDQPFFWVLVL